MKKSLILIVVAAAVVAGAIVLLNQKAPPPPVQTLEATPTPSEPLTQEIATAPKPPQAPAPVVAPPTPAPEPVAIAAAAVAENPPSDATYSIHKIVDALLTARSNKHALFQQLNKEQLEGVITDLQQRALADPKNAGIPTTLGEAQLNLVRVLHAAGADEDQVGILAMQADQSFKAALKIDPKNWEAQYVKASTVFYWPANEARDNDAAQMLAHLIDQQETMPTHPEFAMTYLALGNQYQKMGKIAEAYATWKLGLDRFPTDPQLRQKLAGQ
jgi:cytochrome c-type biogenesis protein CcmH/NrfG